MRRVNKKNVTIIIVSYKSTHIIAQTLKNIIGKGYRIIIVDNGSDDNIEEFLRINFLNSGIELIILANNYGFGKANNVALKKTTTDFALILNPDAIITSQSIDNLVIEARKSDKVALAGPIPSSVKKPNKGEIETDIVRHKKHIKNYAETNNQIETNFICGGYMLMKMAIMKKIGFFDENIFLYGEDDEISRRVLTNGYKNILVKNSQVFHNEQCSTKTNCKWEEIKMLYFRQWHQGWSKAYVKRKRSKIFKIWLVALKKFFTIFYIFLFGKKQFIKYLALSLGMLSNLFGINCFKENNKVVQIKSNINF